MTGNRPSMRRFGIASAAVLALGLSACATTKEHEALQAQVKELSKQVDERDKELESILEEAKTQLEGLKADSVEVEKVLRSSQAGLGVKVEDLEMTVAELRGAADDARMEADSSKRSLEELRADLDTRINALESKLNAATDIPESRSDLLKEADSAFRGNDFSRARRLFRTFLSRYPDDKSGSEVRYKIGLTLYKEQDFRAAAGEFNWIRKNAPRSPVIHDAVYYMGLSFARQGACANATKYFEFLSSRRSGAPKKYRDQAKKQLELIRTTASSMCTDTQTKARG